MFNLKKIVCGTKDEGTATIAQGLLNNTTLERLPFPGKTNKSPQPTLYQQIYWDTHIHTFNDVGIEGAKALGEVIKKNNSLKSISFSCKTGTTHNQCQHTQPYRQPNTRRGCKGVHRRAEAKQVYNYSEF